MPQHCDDELATIAREISAKQLHIESQAILIEVLERDGHEMIEQRRSLTKERSDLASQIARQHRLLEARCTSGD